MVAIHDLIIGEQGDDAWDDTKRSITGCLADGMAALKAEIRFDTLVRPVTPVRPKTQTAHRWQLGAVCASGNQGPGRHPAGAADRHRCARG